MTGFRLATVVLTICVLVGAPAVAGEGNPQNGTIQREPVVNVDVTGSGIAGPMHFRFTVYNDGGVTHSDAFDAAGSSRAGTLTITAGDVARLRRDLVSAGALTLEDQNLSVADLPLTTVTIFRGRTSARAHTFSYWVASDDYAAMGQVIEDFKNRYLPLD